MGDEASVVLLDRATRSAGRLIAGIGPDQWANPTPCEEMDVHALVEHMIASLEQFADVGAGAPFDIEAQRSVAIADASADYGAAAERMASVWSAPEVVDRDYEMPWGTTAGSALVDFLLIEQVTHGWDLATATGQPPLFDEAVVDAALARARQYDDETIRVPGMFGPELPVAHDAPTIDQLAGFLGRATN